MNLEKMISHPDKVFWPDEGYTKLDVAKFYEAVFPRLKPYIRGRLLTMERCPDGMRGECFYQKKAPKGLPDSTPTKRIHHQSGDVDYVVGGSLETQIALVNLGCIPVHVWGSRAEHPKQPDWMVFDLDPGSGKFADSAKAGLLFKDALEDLGLVSFPKTSGSRGLHVFVPLRAGVGFDKVRAFATAMCERLAAEHSDTLTMEQRIERRKGRVFLDAMRNSFGATVAAPYSVRRRPKASFSMPLRWKDITPDLDPSEYNLGNYQKHIADDDPWREFFKHRQSLKLR
jgi:bifunctional non-homologous end joining protein LigD